MLVVAIIAAVGGVMVFYKTIVSPPSYLEFENQYVASINKDIAEVKNAKTDAAIDSIYKTITHMIDFQVQNAKITKRESDELLESFVTQYVPVYVASCNSKFGKSVWNEGELKKMRAHVKELHSLHTSDHKIIIEGEANASLNEINNVIVHYYEAKAVSYVGGYNGLESARQQIASARKYAHMDPINNCTELVNKLNTVAARLEQAHFAYLSSLVERLRPYYNYSQSDYDNLALSIIAKIEEYSKNAESVYGRKSNVESLNSLAGDYYGKATFN